MVLLEHGLLLVVFFSDGKEALVEGIVGLMLIQNQVIVEGLAGSNCQ